MLLRIKINMRGSPPIRHTALYFKLYLCNHILLTCYVSDKSCTTKNNAWFKIFVIRLLINTLYYCNSQPWQFRSWLITGFVTRLTRRVSLVEQELLSLPEHLSSQPFFSRDNVTRSLVLYVCFVNQCLSFFFWSLCCIFFFDIRILITPLIS
jgi:hypothetical protein